MVMAQRLLTTRHRALANRCSVSVGDTRGGGDTIGQRSAFVAPSQTSLSQARCVSLSAYPPIAASRHLRAARAISMSCCCRAVASLLCLRKIIKRESGSGAFKAIRWIVHPVSVDNGSVKKLGTMAQAPFLSIGASMCAFSTQFTCRESPRRTRHRSN